ncbi:hypothetical protein Q3G72_012900 [Acer saccharum]|nr:hypothetical protein Q3G72_012900 [Acer saccharum]
MGHQMACLALLEGLGAEAVWLVPAFTHPFGKALAPFAHRAAMCRLMAAAFGARVQVSCAERDLGGLGRTYDLVSALVAAHPERRFILAIGADIVAETARWHKWDALMQMIGVVVLGRGGYTAHAHTFDLPNIASRTLRAKLQAKETVTGQMPCSVVAYIQAHNLYGAPEV